MAFRTNTITGGRLNLAGALQALTNTTLPPIIVGALPVANEVAPDAPIEIAFNHPMDRASVEAAFQITPNIAGAFQWTNDDRIVRYLHTDALQASLLTTNYTCRLLATAHDLAGRTLDGNFNRASDGSPADDFAWTFSLPLANDNFATAQLISGNQGNIAGTTRYATYQEGEPLFDSTHFYGLSVWYRWAAESSAWMTFDLTQSNKFDSVLGVFTGKELDTLVTNVVNDNYGPLRSSRVSFPATAGETYSIKVAGKWNGSAASAQWGDFLLRWYPTPAPNFTGSEFTPANGVPGGSITLYGTDFTGRNRGPLQWDQGHIHAAFEQLCGPADHGPGSDQRDTGAHHNRDAPRHGDEHKSISGAAQSDRARGQERVRRTDLAAECIWVRC